MQVPAALLSLYGELFRPFAVTLRLAIGSRLQLIAWLTGTRSIVPLTALVQVRS